LAAKKLTDKQIKDIIAARAEGESYTKLAKRYNVSTNTIKNYCNSDDDFAQKCTQKKEENAKTVLEHMETETEVVCNIIDSYLTELANPKKLKNCKIKDIAIALGVIIDKYTKVGSNKDIEKLDEVLKKIGGNI